MITKLEIIHLQMIREMAEAGTITEAAERLCITQSALSRRIKEAERRLDVVLFEKKGKKLFLTSEGQRLLFSADKILKELTAAENDLNNRFKLNKEIVKIGLEPYACFDWLPETLNQTNVRKSVDKIDISVNVINDPLNALNDGEIDLAILPNPKPDEAFNMTSLFKDRLVVVLPSAHSLGKNETIEPQELTSETYLAHESGLDTGSEYDRYFNNLALNPKTIINVGMMDAIIDLVAKGFGFSIISQRTLKPYLENYDVKMVPLKGANVSLDWVAVSRVDNEQVKAMRVEKIIREVNSSNFE